MKKRKMSFALIIVLVIMACSFAVFANAATAEESRISSVSLGALTLAQHSSYVSDPYFGVINVNVENKSVAAASSDTLGHVVITAIGAGTTNVNYWFRTSESGSWISATVPITVPGTPAQNSDSGSGGLAFSQSSLSLPKGGSCTATGITLNGKEVEAADLLWVASSGTVVSVEANTGKITASGAGTAVVYAIDPATKAAAAMSVTVH